MQTTAAAQEGAPMQITTVASQPSLAGTTIMTQPTVATIRAPSPVRVGVPLLEWMNDRKNTTDSSRRPDAGYKRTPTQKYYAQKNSQDDTPFVFECDAWTVDKGMYYHKGEQFVAANPPVSQAKLQCFDGVDRKSARTKKPSKA